MKKRNKILSLALASTVLAGMLAGCTSSPSTTSSTTASSTGGTTTPESQTTSGSASGEPIVLKLQVPWPEKYTENQNVRKMLEEKYNVKFEYYVTPDKEAVNLQIASGDIPEVIREFGIPDYYSAIDQGILAEIPVSLIKENAPNYAKWVESEGIGEQTWNYFMKDDKNYAMLNHWTLATNCDVIGYRKDLLEKAGISKAPETLDEMEAAFKTIKEKLNIAAFTGRGIETLSSVFGAFGTYLCYYDEGGELVYGPIQPDSKKALELLNKWYKAGYIDPEFIVNKTDQLKEKFSSNQAVAIEDCWWDLLPKDAFFGSTYYEASLVGNPEASFIITNPPKGPDGKSGITEGNPVSGVLCFGKQLEKEPAKLAKYMEVFDGSFDREIQDLLYYGVEGETYTYDDKVGRTWIPPYDNEEKRNEFGINLYLLPGCFNDYDLQAKYMTQPQYLDVRNESEAKGIGKYDVLTPFYRPVFNAKSETLDKIYKDNYINFITGSRPISEFDKFVEEWLAAGGKDVLAEGAEKYAAISK